MFVWDDVAIAGGSLFKLLVAAGLVPISAKAVAERLNKRWKSVPVPAGVYNPDGVVVTALLNRSQYRLHHQFLGYVNMAPKNEFGGLVVGDIGYPNPLRREEYEYLWWKFRHDEWDWEVVPGQEQVPDLPTG